MEVIVFVLAVGGIAWVAWKVRSKYRAERDAELRRAWNKVLDDPQYAHRRRFEEHMRENEARIRGDERHTGKAEGL